MDDYKIQIEKIRGFKITGLDLTCRGKQYACPGEFEENGTIALCEHGMHFSEKLINAMAYRPILETEILDTCQPFYILKGRVFEVESYGFFMRGKDKVCTNKLRFIKELSIPEIIDRIDFEVSHSSCYRRNLPILEYTQSTMAELLADAVRRVLSSDVKHFEKQRLECVVKYIDKKGE